MIGSLRGLLTCTLVGLRIRPPLYRASAGDNARAVQLTGVGVLLRRVSAYHRQHGHDRDWNPVDLPTPCSIG